MEIVYGDVKQLNKFKEKVFKVHYNYSLLIWIIQIALEHPLSQVKLNGYYKEVLNIVEYNKAIIPRESFDVQIYTPSPNLYSLMAFNNSEIQNELSRMTEIMGVIDKYCGSYEESDFWGILKPAERNNYSSMYDYIRNITRNNSKTNGDKNKLIFHEKDGSVEYISSSGKKYQAKFGKKTNQYIMLRQLAQNPDKLFTYDELVKGFNEQRLYGESSNEERARHTVKAIRQKFNLSDEDDFFKVDFGYGLNCDVEIIK